MTQKEVVTVVRQYVTKKFESENLYLDDLNVGKLNTKIKESIDEIVDLFRFDLKEIETES